MATPPAPLLLFAATGPATNPPSPLAWLADFGAATDRAGAVTYHCPGKPRSEAGLLPTVRRGTFHEPDPPAPRRDWFGMSVPMTEAELLRRTAAAVPEAEVVAEPLVPARPAAAESELAPRCRPIGEAAAERGWAVAPWYWQAADGTETCALVMLRGDLRAVAYWHRAPGSRWKTGGARAWQLGTWPAEIGPTRLLAAVRTM